ncbi:MULTISPECIES: AAA family ATPase [unclassified Variovorax]|uniref:AAA family ATPase n=1 Tax=unclassified Variovorax TaxID=663243 RepID=UPI00131949EB|nr:MULTISPECIES: AAA family ATPase [unclassified Variovorax]VTU42852.1 ATP-dependent zinc metalloprotease FtsH 4 [Variovorax sp. PBL-H6]VTU43632.1 ATP-dependent zinc metalloprotease FtsH 4 [Variovorax sp. SRS16]VTU43694.1 ATP-dependent zinc metalloprotease FtsH 4 [Variovorax sp. PBL-E5]
MKPLSKPVRSLLRNVALGLALAAVAATSAYFLKKDEPKAPELTGVAQQMRAAPEEWSKVEKDGSELLSDLRADKVSAVGIAGSGILVATTSGEKYFVVDGRGSFAALAVGEAKNPEKKPFQLVVLPNSKVGSPDVEGAWLGTARDVAGLLLPLLLIGGLVFLVRKELGGNATLVEQPTGIRFDDVIGAMEAKNALKDVVAYLKDPKRFSALGGRPPCGVLALGGPGVGKTLLAKALAGECGASFIAINGGEFTSKFYGVGVQKVKGVFELARKNAPCILFIDEIDGIAKRTSSGSGPVESESNRIINQVLVEMDGFASNEGVIVVGATNLAENLDEALLREGRFDRRVTVRHPDVRDRAEIFKLYGKKLKLHGPMDWDQLARLTTGLSPATIAHIVNHAAIVAGRHASSGVEMHHFVESVETTRIGELNGAERALSDEERAYIAVHEAGHAITAAVLSYGNVEKVTILPRGGALGVTLVTQDEDKTLMLRSDMENHIVMLLGGRNAELEVFAEASSGASHDLQEASKLALDMVGRYGFGADGSLFSLGALPAQHAAQHVTAAVRQADILLKSLSETGKALLRVYRGALDALTDELLRDETVDGTRVLELVRQVRATR